MTGPVPDTRDLLLVFKSHRGTAQVLQGIALNVLRGERMALVGESGSGKPVTARIVLGPVQGLRLARVSGEARFQGRDVNARSERDRHSLRGTDISMIFQDPTSALNPVFTICDQFHEVSKRRDTGHCRAAALARAAKALAEVSIHDPARVPDVGQHEPAGDDRHGTGQCACAVVGG